MLRGLNVECLAVREICSIVHDRGQARWVAAGASDTLAAFLERCGLEADVPRRVGAEGCALGEPFPANRLLQRQRAGRPFWSLFSAHQIGRARSG